MEWNTVERAKDRNRHKNRIKRSGQARLVYVWDINRNIPTTRRWAAGTGDSTFHNEDIDEDKIDEDHHTDGDDDDDDNDDDNA